MFDPQNQRLYVEAEEKLTGDLWKGDFQAKYIEDITTKTGVPKKFGVFAKMLVQALRGGSDQVCVDLLTYADLEALKNQRGSASQAPVTNSSKRYLILTYISEFERVHYPLSLAFVEEPEPDQLRRTIERMRGMITMQRSDGFAKSEGPTKIEDFASIEVENDRLRKQISEIEQ